MALRRGRLLYRECGCVCFLGNIQGIVLVIVLAALGACSTTVRQAESTDYKARAEMQTEGKVEVSAVVLSAEESVESFGFALDKKQIQPVWIKVENRGSTPVALLWLPLKMQEVSEAWI